MRRRLAMLTGTLIAAGTLAACDPPPPLPILLVTTDAAGGHDADPGDGVCEVAAGAGECTLGAALEEANALGRAEIHLPDDDALPELDRVVEVTGELVIRGLSTTPGSPSGARGLTLDVASGATLTLDHFGILDGTVVVRGVLAAEAYQGLGNLDVRAGGVAVVRNSYLYELRGGPAVSNAGTLLLRHSTVETGVEEWMPPSSSVHTALGATTQLHTSWVTFQGMGTACSGAAPTSLGYNADVDGTCALGATGDLSDLADPYFYPSPGSPLRDAIPQGEAGCGTEDVVDFNGDPRPTDGDGDGVAACDIGAWEP